MSADYQILLLCYIIHWLALVFLVIKSKNRIRTILFNVAIQIIYSAILFYNLQYNSAGGAGLVWLVYLMFVIGLHWLVNLVILLLKIFKKKYQVARLSRCFRY